MRNSDRIAFVTPTLTDMNRGDQALVWEAAALAIDSACFDDVILVDSEPAATEGRAGVQGQTSALGHRVVRTLLRDPRRGRNQAHDKIQESTGSFLRLALHAVGDWLSQLWLLAFAKRPSLAGWVLDAPRRETLDLLRNSQAMFIKGGGFIHAHGETRAPYYIWHALFYLRLAHRLGVPVYVLPNSFGPFEGRTVKRQVRGVLSRCKFIAARESISARMLGDLLGREIPVYPDMGYFLDAAPEEQGRERCLSAGVPLGDKPCVGLTLRPWRFPGTERPEEKFSEYLASMATLVRHIAGCGMHPVLVTHVLGPSAHENDNLAIDELVPRISDVEFSRVDFDGDCADLKAVYGCMDYVVGTRFHSVIFAQGAGTPAMAIAYGGNKGVGIMNDLGLGDFVIPIEDVSGESLCRKFDELVSRRPEIVTLLSDWAAQAARRRAEMLELITADLEGRPPRDLRTSAPSAPTLARTSS